MKKLVSILLALAMIFALGAPVFAETENTTLIITNSTDRDYAGYKLLNLTTSLKTGEHHPEHTGDHDNDCYNYAYTVNATYRAILQAEVFANGGNYLWEGTTKPATADGITDAQILLYLEKQTSDEGDVFHTMRMVADRLYRAIKAAGITAEEPALEGNDEIAQGYWIIADVTALDGNEANSLVMVSTKGQEALTINPKVGLPTVEKKVKDINTSADDSITDNAWHDSADHDIGDTVPFKLTATMPSNVLNYETYQIVFHDELAEGLTLNPGSFKVYMYDTVYKANVDIALANYAKDVTNNFTITSTGLTDDCTFEVSCQNVLAIGDVTGSTTFVVYYEATLNENATMGAAGNPNEVYLEFSNDPYGNGTGNTESDKVTVFTYQVIINKTDSHGHELKGAGFKLYKKNAAGEYVLIGNEKKGDDMVTFVWKGLDDGDYKLEESTVPEGYNKMTDLLFSIFAVHTETAGEPALETLDGGVMGAGVVDTGAITKNIVNNTGTVLPETGAEGTFFLITAGAVLVVLAAVVMITRKKMSVYED